MINYYLVLEIPDFSNETVIKKAYRSLSKKYHPDVNSDPFASTYFHKINEAYNFLMDDNRRMLLHQFLSYQQTDKLKPETNQTSYKEKNTTNPHPETHQILPVIHFFGADKKHFLVNDRILLQWNVSQCQAVSFNFFGEVAFSGTHYLKIDQYADEVIVVMSVIGLSGKEYKYQIKLFYDDSNPSKKAFHKISSQFPDVDEIHFKEESFFGMHARINNNEFKNRMILLGSLFVVCIILMLKTSVSVLFFLITLALLWVIFSQCYKRLHDTELFKYKAGLLFVPFYNFFLIKKLLVLQSEQVVNVFGMVPAKTAHTFKSWLANKLSYLNKQLTPLQKISFGSFLLLSLLIFFKSIYSYEEKSVSLTSYYINSARPEANGYVQRDYFIVFNDKIPVRVPEQDFNDIVYKKKFDTFKIANTVNNKIEYIKVTNSENNFTERINFGVFAAENPLLLIAFLLFLSQLYVWRNLTAIKEQGFVKGYMVFVMMVYVCAILLAI